MKKKVHALKIYFRETLFASECFKRRRTVVKKIYNILAIDLV